MQVGDDSTTSVSNIIEAVSNGPLSNFRQLWRPTLLVADGSPCLKSPIDASRSGSIGSEAVPRKLIGKQRLASQRTHGGVPKSETI